MQTSILILNGPNLNLLGTRQPEVYGTTTLADVERSCVALGKDLGLQVTCQQDNHEGGLVDKLHAARGVHRGVIFNAGAYTHTSITLRDAITAAELPVIELHISNVHAREDFRHHSMIAPVCAGVICGFGTNGYLVALRALKDYLGGDV